MDIADIIVITENIQPLTFIDYDKVYKEEFKQAYYIRQTDEFNSGIYLPYIISSFGRLFSYKLLSNGMYSISERKLPVDKNGYNLVVLNYRRNAIGCRIHRMVASTFIENNDPLKNEVNHIDGIKTHNYIWNLEWCTSTENKYHAKTHNLARYAKGSESGKSIYTDDQIIRTCELLEDTKLSKTEISKITGVSQHMVNDLYKRRYWNHIVDKYDFSAREKMDLLYDEKVRTVCSMLENNKSIKKITETTGFGFKFVSAILHRKTQTKISASYDFSNYNYGK